MINLETHFNFTFASILTSSKTDWLPSQNLLNENKCYSSNFLRCTTPFMTPTVRANTTNSLSKIEYLTTPFMQTLHGSLPDAPTCPMLTRHLMSHQHAPLLFPNFPSSNSLNCFCNNKIIRIKRFRRHAHSELSSLDNASSTRTKNSGLRTETWCTPTLTLKAF